MHLYHFSEDPSITRFEPRVAPTSNLQDRPLVWAIDAEHAHLYYFPRQCPRVTFYAVESTTNADIERFMALSAAKHVVAIESAWLPAMRSTRLYRYEMPLEGFELQDAGAGHYVNDDVVVPLRVDPVGDLIDAHATAGVELRVTPSLWPLYEAVIASTLPFSIIRWRNASATSGNPPSIEAPTRPPSLRGATRRSNPPS